MDDKNATRICDICGTAYFGSSFGPFGDNICPNCMSSTELPLITEDDPTEISLDEDGGVEDNA